MYPVSKDAGIAYRITRESKILHAAAVIVILAMDTSCLSSGYHSVLVSTCRWRLVALGCGPEIIIASNSIGLVSGKSCTWRLFLSVVPLLEPL